MRIEDAEFVVVDVETTGLRADHDRIIEIGAVRVKGHEPDDVFAHLVDPECMVPGRITQITGITTNDVLGQPKMSEVLPDFIEFLGDAVFVAHYAKFDWGFIQAALHRAELPPLQNRTLCTVRLARRLLRGLPSRSLGSLIKHFGLPADRLHRARSDAFATQGVLVRLLRMLERQHEITDLEEVLHFQNAPYKKSAAGQERLEEIRKHYLSKLPDLPGVYRMRRKDGKLLYIGKARLLSERVRSYFAGTESQPKHIRAMIRQIHDIKWTETGTELEALLLESCLIKEHVPPYNKAAKEYRNQPFLRLGKISSANWVTLIEHVRADGAKHYGPMANRKEAIHLAQLLVSLYGASPESFRSPRRLGIGLETARIGGPLTEDGFLRAVEILEGHGTQVLSALETRMQEASRAKEYELAAKFRDWLEIVKRIHSRPQFLRTPLLERTGAAIHTFKGKIEVHFMACGVPVAHSKWPCDQNAFNQVKATFHERVLDAPDRLSRQQMDAVRVLGAWMFRERAGITVLPLAIGGSLPEFDAALEAVLDQMHTKQ